MSIVNWYIIQRRPKREALKHRGIISAFISMVSCWMSNFSQTKISLLHYSSIIDCYVMIFGRHVDSYITQWRSKREALKHRGRISAFISVVGCWMSNFSQTKVSLLRYSSIFDVTSWYLADMSIDILSSLHFSLFCLDIWKICQLIHYSAMTKTRGSETQRHNFSIHFCGGLLNEQFFPNKSFAAPLLLHFWLLRHDIWQTCQLIYYPATSKMRGSETQRHNFSIHFYGELLNEQFFPNKNFAAPLHLHFWLLRHDIWQTCRLIYYSATIKTRGSEMQRQNFSIDFCVDMDFI